ncbi:MAG: ribonuclease, partial [Bacteroidota bacterium]
DDGRLILNEELTKAPPPPRSIAYVSDTIFHPPILPQIQGVDLLYHEATFLHELLETAEITMHTTARQAAMMAEMAGAGKLVIGHYSSRYTDMQPLLNETRQVFPNTELGEEGKTYDA